MPFEFGKATARNSLLNALDSKVGKRAALEAFYSKPMLAGAGGALALTAAYNLVNQNDLTDLSPVMAVGAGVGLGAMAGRVGQRQFGSNVFKMAGALEDEAIRAGTHTPDQAIEHAMDWANRTVSTLKGIDRQIPVPTPEASMMQQAHTWLTNVAGGGERGRQMREIMRMDLQKDGDVLKQAFELSQRINLQSPTAAATATEAVAQPAHQAGNAARAGQAKADIHQRSMEFSQHSAPPSATDSPAPTPMDVVQAVADNSGGSKPDDLSGPNVGSTTPQQEAAIANAQEQANIVQDATETEKKKRGRPAGSKNKPKKAPPEPPGNFGSSMSDYDY